jgi:hypothetical protein
VSLFSIEGQESEKEKEKTRRNEAMRIQEQTQVQERIIVNPSPRTWSQMRLKQGRILTKTIQATEERKQRPTSTKKPNAQNTRREAATKRKKADPLFKPTVQR